MRPKKKIKKYKKQKNKKKLYQKQPYKISKLNKNDIAFLLGEGRRWSQKTQKMNKKRPQKIEKLEIKSKTEKKL